MEFLIETTFAPSAYPKSQIKLACLVARTLSRGKFVLLEDPADGDER